MDKTALQWFIEQLPIRIKNAYHEEIGQALEMEKKQIVQAVYDAMGTNFDPNWGRAELYYNETYKGGNK